MNNKTLGEESFASLTMGDQMLVIFRIMKEMQQQLNTLQQEQQPMDAAPTNVSLTTDLFKSLTWPKLPGQTKADMIRAFHSGTVDWIRLPYLITSTSTKAKQVGKASTQVQLPYDVMVMQVNGQRQTDGHGNVVDENGGPEPMEYIVDQEEFVVEAIATHTEYLEHAHSSEFSQAFPMLVEKAKDEDIRMKEANVKREYVRYTVQDKVRFFDLKIEKCMSASATAKQLGIHIRTAQRWVKQYNMRPESIFEVCKSVGRKCILSDEHKTAVVEFIDANPSAAVVEVTEHLLKRFNDLKVSRSTVYNFMRKECNLSLKKAEFHSIERNSPAKIEERYDWVRKWENTDMSFLKNCVFLDESAFDINMKRSRAWSKQGTPAIVTRPTTRANTTSILGAISAAGLIAVGVKKTKTC
ncbi:hypothetical protein BC941DRAFT_518741 [Chlamydoabsidia padenii]|nr:hypothetical protein BC941DRAFT_518741 [Chlamydoabsidia padenii]